MAAAILLPTLLQAGGIRSVAADGATVVVEFDDIVSKASVFALSGPDRIAVDIEGATVGQNEMLAGGASAKCGKGNFNSDTARLVFDLDQPVVVTGGSFAADGRSLRLKSIPTTGD